MQPPSIVNGSDRRPAIPDEVLGPRVVAIGRRLDPSRLAEVTAALREGGVRAFELTLDAPEAIEAIARLAASDVARGLLVGAGGGRVHRPAAAPGATPPAHVPARRPQARRYRRR